LTREGRAETILTSKARASSIRILPDDWET
jgi:hypothetical protein